MSQPLYFLPGVYRQQLVSGGELSRAILNERGIGDTFADVRAGEFYACDVEGGPGGKSGLMLAYQTPKGQIPQHTKYVARLQEWSESYDGKVWIGVEIANPPAADDLVRRSTYRGYELDIGKRRFEVPIIRRVDDSSELPRDMFFDAKGNLVEPIKAAYRKYWDDSSEVSDWFFAGTWSDKNKSKALLLAVQALSLNYRYTLLEHNALRFVDAESFMSVLMATVDVPHAKALEEAEKKTESPSAAENTTPGCEDTCPDSDPAGESYTPPASDAA